uniref:Uncharacterized protein n=1 Tax=Branchiostoma floridae TaxID=7739 RepID=C3ZBB0_BRAFL|eukprot:XP_002594136.1 hypothetical protein BRAFLDRAFT_68422 [Branchiostoma floridae]
MATAAAAVKGGGAPSNRAAACNIWALDQIWKARIAQEHRAYKKWPMDWGFMATDYKDLVKDEIRPLDRPKLEMPETLRLPLSLPSRIAVVFLFNLVKDEIRPLDRPKLEMPETLRLPPITPIEKYIKVDKSPPLPRSSAGYIGWRSGDKLYNLERYGGYARGKGGLIRQLKWPDEGVD